MSNSHLFMKSGFIRTPLQNGVGRYVCQLQRVVLKFCKEHGASRGMRDFIENDLVQFAKDNPGVVVYLKPRRHRGPVISAEYLSGNTQHLSCRNFSSEIITKWMEHLKSQSDNHEGFRLRKMYHTDHPSIQGPWTPYTFRDSALNMVKYPNAELGKAESKSKTASERIMEIYKQQPPQVELKSAE